MLRAGRRADRSERGVAAVEAGLITMFLSPLVIGVLFYGNYFWQAQQANDYTPRVSQSTLLGNYASCTQLEYAVRSSVLANLSHLDGAAGLGLGDITASVVDYQPGQLGVDVQLSVRVPVVKSPVSSILPNNGDLVSEVLTRLENVRLTNPSC